MRAERPTAGTRAAAGPPAPAGAPRPAAGSSVERVRSAPRAETAGALRAPLDAIRARYREGFLDTDPLSLVVPLRSRLDREVGGFLAAGIAHGRVASIRESVSDLWRRTRGRPGTFARTFDARRDAPRLAGWGHRWTRDRDMAAVLVALRRLLARHGSLEAAVAAGLSPGDGDVGPALARFAAEGRALLPRGAGRGALWFFTSPEDGSACKRLNMWLRWMVRTEPPDLGLWARVSPSLLVLPLDTHLARIARYVGLTDHRTAGWRAAHDATLTLRLLDSGDPVKYDFALARLGIVGDCRHRRVAEVCRRCPLDRLCRLE